MKYKDRKKLLDTLVDAEFNNRDKESLIQSILFLFDMEEEFKSSIDNKYLIYGEKV